MFQILVQRARPARHQERSKQCVEHSLYREVVQIIWVTQIESGERRDYDEEVYLRLRKSQEIGDGRT
jgi:hypothetical protein